jgi:serine/threonine-protein kinase
MADHLTTSPYQPGMRISEYLLETRIGGGTFGEVWRARHHVWDSEHVAIKLPTAPEYVRYLQREGMVVHGLRHANIVRVIGFDPFNEHPYLVMELINGPSLRAAIDEHPQGLPTESALRILQGILLAMQAAHDANILHRDLKPGNVLLNLGDRPIEQLAVDDVKIGDFGLGVNNAETLRSIAQSASLARDDELVGTLAYMAPELRDHRGEPSPRTDLYAVGVMLFEMFTGERPAGAELPSTVRADVPGFVDDVFRKLYARAEARYARAADVLAELTPPARPAVPVPPPPVPGGARREGFACPDCRNIADPDDQFCTQCGRQLVEQIRRCPSCQAFPATHDQYCIFCGAALSRRSTQE